MKYKTEKDISETVRAFENGTISRDDWRHAEHLTVALYYVWHHDFDLSLDRMRAGIFNLLRAFEVDLTKEMPYHETLTRFWMGAVSDFRNTKKTARRFLKRATNSSNISTKITRLNFTAARFCFPMRRGGNGLSLI